MHIAHVYQQLASQDACVAQLGTLLTQVQLQAPFTEIGQEFITGLLWVRAISSQLPGTLQNVTVCWRTFLWCLFCWGVSAASALWLGLCPSSMFWLSAELTRWLPVLRCSFWSLHRWASSETRGAAQRPITIADRSVKPDLMVWPKWPNPIFFFFSWYRFSSYQRQGKACWKFKWNNCKFCCVPAT